MDNNHRLSFSESTPSPHNRHDDPRGTVRRSILKKQSFIDDVHDDLERALDDSVLSVAAGAPETPEQWFQRILKQRAMSPLDLCDLLCLGDARKHRVVLLKSVCEKLFELDPGNDPLTETMEDFLFQFSFDQADGEIVVDIIEALRTLDIWQTAAAARSPTKYDMEIGSPHATVSPAKATMLQVKALRLQQVITSLQEENIRLSHALQEKKKLEGEEEEGEMDAQRPPSPLKLTIKKPATAHDVSPKSDIHGSRSPTKTTTVVSRHEQELVTLASQLEYTGVKKLEELLAKSDVANTKNHGFVSLKQLRWLLSSECGVDTNISESKLMELCMGMNFNAQAQLDYKEFVRVLLDILVYESCPPRPSSSSSSSSASASSSSSPSLTNQPSLSEEDEAALAKVREYLHGFSGSREKTRKLLDVLCDKYDLEGNQRLSLTELARVCQSDLPSQHPYKLKFPLTASDTKRLLATLGGSSSSSSPRKTRSAFGGNTDSVFLPYPAILNAFFRRTSSTTDGSVPQPDAMLARVLQPEFWHTLRRALCAPTDRNASSSLERKIHAQLCKILLKLDPQQSFGVAHRHFVRVFDQHWSARDLELLAMALSCPLGHENRNGGSGGAAMIRYDVLMKMLFGAPALRDARSFATIIYKLQRHESRWREELQELCRSCSSQTTSLSYMQVYELLMHDTQERDGDAVPPFNTTEFLYLIAQLKDDRHRIPAQTLWKTLVPTDSTASSPTRTRNSAASSSSSQFTILRQRLRLLCDDHDLEKTLARRARHEHGVVRLSELCEELHTQLRVLRLPPHEKEMLNFECIQSFLDAVANGSDDTAAPTADSLYIHALMDAIFDWDGLITALQLPDRLVDVKKTLELFDWHKDGSIDASDWNKAYRQLTAPSRTTTSRIDTSTKSQQRRASSPLYDWEMRVLLQRFSASSAPAERQHRGSAAGSTMIDFSRLLVFLLERQQRIARDQLTEAVCLLLQQACARVTRGKPRMTTFHLEQAFEFLDRDGKGYFHLNDLTVFVTQELAMVRESLGVDVQSLRSYAMQAPAMEAVMHFLIGGKDGKTKGKRVVSLMRFQELVNHGFFQQKRVPQPHRGSGSGSANSRRPNDHDHDHDETLAADESANNSSDVDEDRPSRGRSHHRGSSSSSQVHTQITLLRELEQCVYEIASQFTDPHGLISPTAAFNHLNNSTTSHQQQQQQRRPRSQSPVRTSSSPQWSASASTSSYSSRRSSFTTSTPYVAGTPVKSREDPLSVSRLKHTLRDRHGIETSTHLIGQLFLKLGAKTKHFLELPVFAIWLTPLSVDLQSRVKQIVREMLAKGKAGGGHVDLERFLNALTRRMQDALAAEGAMVHQRSGYATSNQSQNHNNTRVRPGVLLTRLHQLNVSMRKPEMIQLLRHFGLEDQHEIDYHGFIRRIYELARQRVPLQY